MTTSFLIAEGDVLKATVFLTFLGLLLFASLALLILSFRAQKAYKNEALPSLAPEDLGDEVHEDVFEEKHEEEGGFSLPSSDVLGSMDEGDEQANELLRAAHRTQASASAEEEAKAKNTSRGLFRRKA